MTTSSTKQPTLWKHKTNILKHYIYNINILYRTHLSIPTHLKSQNANNIKRLDWTPQEKLKKNSLILSDATICPILSKPMSLTSLPASGRAALGHSTTASCTAWPTWSNSHGPTEGVRLVGRSRKCQLQLIFREVVFLI